MRNRICLVVVGALLIASLTGCTVHPQGEKEERNASVQAGKPFEKPPEQRQAPPLPDNPSPDDLVHYALLTNADLEQRYWEWRSAIEQIPQDGAQPTNLALSAAATLNNGNFSADRTTLTALNDPMADIVWPEKLSVAATRALEIAHAAGLRFQKAKFDLRNKVLAAYYDYALDAELIRLEQENTQLMQITLMAAESRNRAGAAGQQDVLKARNDLDESTNDLAHMKSQLPGFRSQINALLNRDINAALPVPAALPATQAVHHTDDQLLALAARQNPELAALASEIRGRSDGIRLARLQYVPDFSLSAGIDLAGDAESLAGMVTLPLLRYQAINAAIAQAQANLKSTQAMRRQASNELAARIIIDLTTLRDADRQLALFEYSIIPRARQTVTLARMSYETARSPLPDLLDSQRSLLALRRLVANLRVERAKMLADLEAITAQDLQGDDPHPH